MGTRSLTILPGEVPGEEAAVMYRQMDGYPTGHGQELADFLRGAAIVNGIPFGGLENEDGDAVLIFNGPACLAAAIVAHFKEGPGGFYLYPAGTRDTGEEYVYTIIAAPVEGLGMDKEGGKIGLKVECSYAEGAIFEGFADDFDGDEVEAALNARMET